MSAASTTGEPMQDRWRLVRPGHSVAFAGALLLLVLSLAGCRCGAERAGGGARKGPAVVVVDPDEVAGADADPEKEPNNDRAAAQELEEGRVIGGTIAAPTDQDWYAVKVDADKILTATVSGVAGIDLVLEALSAEGRRLVRVDNHLEGGGETLVNLAVEQGRYHLRVTARTAAGSKAGSDAGAGMAAGGARVYRVGYRLRHRDPAEELEPNWKMTSATPLALGGEAVGFLGWHTDTDWYRVDLAARGLQAGSLLRAEFDGVDDVRATLAVHDAQGALLQRRVGRLGEAVVLANLAVPVAHDALYVVVRCGQQANVESQYAVRVSAQVPPRPNEAEPNDTPAQATPIIEGKVIEGLVADDADRDFYALAASGPVSVVVSPPAGVDVALAVVEGSSGKVLLEVDAERAGGAEVIPSVSLAAPGTLLRVRAPRAGECDPLRSYRLLVRPRAAGADLSEVEPNDRPEQATRWPAGASSVRGTLHPAGDVDCYLLSCAAVVGQQRTLRATGRRRPALLEVLDAQGKPLVKSDVVAADGSLRLALPATGRPCVVRVSGAVGAAAATDPYELTLEAMAAVVGPDPVKPL